MLPQLFLPETMEGRGHVLGSMAEKACKAVVPLPKVLQAPLSFVLTLTTMLVLCFSNTNPTMSLAWLETVMPERGKKRSPRVRYFPPLSPPPYPHHHVAPHP